MSPFEVARDLGVMYAVALFGYHVVGRFLYNTTQRRGWRGFNLDDR